MKKLETPLDYAKASIETMMRKYTPEELPHNAGFHYIQGVFFGWYVQKLFIF